MISVVIASYNGAKFIVKQLDSIKNQTLCPDEVIVIDDSSSDNTVNIIKEYIKNNNLTNWKIIIQPVNRGYSLNFFDGIFYAQGDMIFLSDQDDLWHKEKIQEMSQLFQKDSNLFALSSRYNIINDKDEVIPNPGINFAPIINDGSIQDITAGRQIGCSLIRGCSLCISSKIKEYLIPLSLDDFMGHDWLLSITAAFNGKCGIYNKCLMSYRCHDSNYSLSSISRKSLIGDFNKRINGLKNSIEAYEVILSNKTKYKNFNPIIEKQAKKQISFEKKRLKFLENRNFFVWLSLIIHLPLYSKYYNSFKGGIKIYLGDFAYANNKIFSKLKI